MLVYLIVAGCTLGALQLLATRGSSPFTRTFTSTGTGLGSFHLLTAYTSTASFLNSAWDGSLGWSGTFMISGLFALCGVWGYNLFSSRGHLVR